MSKFNSEKSNFLKIKLKNNTKEALEIGWKTDSKTHYKSRAKSIIFKQTGLCSFNHL